MTLATDDQLLRLGTQILKRAYALDATNLDATAYLLGKQGWAELVEGMELEEADTGGGFAMLTGELPDLGYFLSITDGESSLPRSTEDFYVGITQEPGEGELYFVSARNGVVDWRGGELVEEGRVPVLLPRPLR